MFEESRSKIEDIKKNLYDKGSSLAGRHFTGTLHKVKHDYSDEWVSDIKDKKNDEETRKPKSSFFKKFFIVSILFFIGAVGFGVYKFYTGGVSVSNDNIEIVVFGNAFTKGGEELPLQIEINNHNNAKLEFANLIVSYPSGASDDVSEVTRLPRENIGTIEAGESVSRNFKVKLFGDEKSVREVNISLEYHPEGSNAIFTKEEIYPVTISLAPLSLSIDAPETVTSDQNFSFEVKTVLNTSLPEGGPTILQLNYPDNFVFDSATPEPTFGNSVWGLDSLSLTNPISVNVTGRLVGQTGDEQVIRAYAGLASTNNQSVVDITYNSLLHSIILEKPFLEAKILVNNQDLSSYSASADSEINAQISWVNNLTSRITDAQIIVGLSGNALDKSSINPGDGFYDSANSQVVWDKNMIDELSSIEPGEKGQVNLRFNSISLIGGNVKDPQINLNVSIKGRQPGLGSSFSDVNNFANKTIKISSDFQIASSARYSSGFLPPKAEGETKYVVTWTLSNTSNSISGAQARAILPIYVDWGESLTGGSEKISYNEVTREVVWDIGSVNPKTGFGSSREASFMVILHPSMSQVGSVPQLMKEIYLLGQDVFTGESLKSKYNPITTYLTNDVNFNIGDQKVIQ